MRSPQGGLETFPPKVGESLAPVSALPLLGSRELLAIGGGQVAGDPWMVS